MYDIKQVYPAKSIKETLTLLKEHPGSRIISGGSDLLIKIREGKFSECSLVSIHNVPELKGVFLTDDGSIKIMAATTFSHLENDPIIKKHIKVLGEAAGQVGGPQIRNIGTIGGNISNGVTSADTASTLFCWDAKVEIMSEDGNRILPITEYYLGAGKVDLRPGELLGAIIIDKASYEGYTGCYIKYSQRNAMDIATLGCSVSCKIEDNVIVDVRLAFGVAGPIPMRCIKAEESIKGMKIDDKIYGILSKTALEEVKPRDSWRASKEFRLHLIEELSQRALKSSIEGGLL